MVTFPNCKINLGLNITRKREDGYHDLETVFYPIFLKDVLEVVRENEPARQSLLELLNSKSVIPNVLPTISFSTTGLTITGSQTDNLCVKAYLLLQKDFPQLPTVKMQLHKVIPMGAGLGGGSADGAFALRLLNEKFNLGLSYEQLVRYALVLGSDCPFFILNKPCFATGRGEIITEIALDLSSYRFVIVHPGIHINTGWAFSKIIPQAPTLSIKTTIQQSPEKWKDILVNDFEKPAITQFPEIGACKTELYRQGAVYASMTGSGSTVYGLFKKEQPFNNMFPTDYFVADIEN